MTSSLEYRKYHLPSELEPFHNKIIAFKEVESSEKVEEVATIRFALIKRLMDNEHFIPGVSMEILYSKKKKGKTLYSLEDHIRSYADGAALFNKQVGWNRLYVREASKEELSSLAEKARKKKVVLPFSDLFDDGTTCNYINSNIAMRSRTRLFG